MKEKVRFFLIIFFSLYTHKVFSTSYQVLLDKNIQPLKYSHEEAFALLMDQNDPLKKYREQFYYPTQDGQPILYLNGNSLGLQPQGVQNDINRELRDWADFGVEGHFKKHDPWYTYHEQFSPLLAPIVGAFPHEVVAMNTLTVNLHLMLSTFYRPKGKRTKIIMEAPVFSSDTYAIQSQIRLHNLNPDQHLIIIEPSQHLTPQHIQEALNAHKGEVALVILSAVNFLTGQAIDISSIAKITHDHGAYFGIDAAHAVGNIPLKLHDDNVDFAVWCSYKYLNAGPGAIGGAFIHESHSKNTHLFRLAGWWGNDSKQRFSVMLERKFTPSPSADGWQISNPPIFSMIPLKASLNLYQQVGMEAYREKSLKLTGYLEFLLKPHVDRRNVKILTPSDPKNRGCQLSVIVYKNPLKFRKSLKDNRIVCDFREPNVIRIAPVPFYNSFHEVWQFVQVVNQYFSS